MSHRGLYISYQKAGVNFLAYKMERIFTRIESDEDAALHNDILTDVLSMVEGEGTQFFRGMADAVLYPRVNKRKRFLFRVADLILQIGQKKG